MYIILLMICCLFICYVNKLMLFLKRFESNSYCYLCFPHQIHRISFSKINFSSICKNYFFYPF